jgi:3-hydroxyacyl-CoA dehydrogenase
LRTARAAGLKKGLALIQSNFNRSRRLSDEQKAEYFSRITGATDYAAVADCDLVVEAVFESMDVKKQIFGELDKVCKPGAFMCSNTSALNIDEIASATSRPEYVMGTHFFSPANVMKLLENVKGSKTSEETIASMMEWGKNIGKWCILVGNCPGFVGNRMVGFYGGQARVMLEEGLLPTDVDGAVSDRLPAPSVFLL